MPHHHDRMLLQFSSFFSNFTFSGLLDNTGTFLYPIQEINPIWQYYIIISATLQRHPPNRGNREERGRPISRTQSRGAEAQYFLIGQPVQSGRSGEQRVCPNETRWLFQVFQYFTGNILRSVISVSNGVLVLINPSRLQMRWTWTSTHIAGKSNPTATVKFAVLRPTPGNSHNSSTVRGKTPPNFSLRTRGNSFK